MKILNEIQKTLKAPKSQFNAFGKYNYRSCEDILEAIKPLLGSAILTISDDIQLVGDRVYVKSTATIKDGDVSESCTAFAREPENKKGMDESQITGAASSYARKYALNGLFCIDDTKDADNTNKHDNAEKQHNEWLTPSNIKLWQRALDQLSKGEITIEGLKKKIKIRTEHEEQLKEELKTKL